VLYETVLAAPPLYVVPDTSPDPLLLNVTALVTAPDVVAYVAFATVPDTLAAATELAVVAYVAKLAVPLSAPTNVVAVIDALAKLELIEVLNTAWAFPLADEVVNVGYTVVALDVFCNKADAFVALDTVPDTLAAATELATAA
jgi:hypothetical protein